MKNYRADYSFIGGLLTGLSFLMSLPVQATLVGSTPGGFSVSQSGAAHYSIPIQVPPGIGGMAPQLSLAYSSRSGNGLLGLGWNLGGLSSVTRCPATKAQDNLIDGVDFDSNDKFCLDGQRMVLGPSPNTGTDSYGVYTEYRTEIDTFSRIRSYGTAGVGPASFRVSTRSGQKMEYGVTTDSRIEAQGRNDVLIWALNKVMDTAGNYMTVSYTENATTHEFRPSQIDYTGNTGQSVSTYASVQFEYENRNDDILHYLSGSRVETTVRMTAVKTYVGATLAKKYNLSYENHGAASLSRLLSVTECDGQTTPQCLPPTEFDWKAETKGFINSTYDMTDVLRDYDNGELQKAELIDLDGDGLPDWVAAYKLGGSIDKATLLNNGSGFQWFSTPYYLPGSTVIRDYDMSPSGARYGEFVDVNADGLPDWVVAYENTSGTVTKKTYLNLGNGWDNGTNFGALPTVITDYDIVATGERQGEFADVNGDGLPDWVRAFVNSGGVTHRTTYLNTGSGWSANSGYQLPTYIMHYSSVSTGVRSGEFVDVNGDGLPDFVQAFVHTTGVTYRNTYLNTGSGWSANSNYDLPNYIMHYSNVSTGIRAGDFVDLNGDGLVDWVRSFVYTNGSIYSGAYLNTGSGWVPDSNYEVPYNGHQLRIYSSVPTGIKTAEFVDVNGDGLLDYVAAWKASNGTNVQGTHLNTGSGWVADSNYLLPDVITNYQAFTTGMRYGDFADLNGDGIKDWVRGFANTSGTEYINTWLSRSNSPGLIIKVTSGLGAETDITYKYLTDDTVYTKGAGASYPEVDIQSPVSVVSQVATDNGIGGMLTKNFTYTGLKADYEWGGLSGFASMTVVDAGTGIKTISNYNQVFPYGGQPSLSEQKKSNNDLISSAQYFYDGQADGGGTANCSSLANMPVLCKRVEKVYDFDSGSLLVTTTTETTYDSYNNPDLVTVTTVGNSQTFITETDNTFTNDTTNWLLGLLDRSEVQKTHPDTSTATQIAEYDYDSSTGLLVREIIEPDSTNASIRLTTAYVRDGFGNITRTTLCDGAVTPSNCTQSSTNARSTQTSYTSNSSLYPNGLFATGITNALNQSETRVHDVRFGGMTSLTGPNGLTTTWGYDSLGRKILEHRADGTETNIVYENCSSCPYVESIPPEYTVTTTVTGKAPEIVYVDALDRQIRKRTTYDGANYVYTDTKYDARGRVEKQSEPYFSGYTPVWTIYDYDLIDRVVELDPPHTAELITTDYNGFSTAVTTGMTSPLSDQVKVQVLNAIGQTVSVTEADGATEEVTTVYRYDAAGNLEETEVNDEDATIIHMDYDVRARKTAMDDPDMGHWEYEYNAFGELISQTDAKSQLTTMQYDKLGRMTLRVDDDGGADVENTFTWGVFSAAKNIGKLTSISVEGGSSTTYTYDSVGRPATTTSTIDSNTFVTEQSYDGTTGFPLVTTYPDTAKYSTGFQVRRVYNSSGALIRVENTDTPTPEVYWEADAAYRNARGQVEVETFGNGIDSLHTYNPATGWLEGARDYNSTDDVYHASYTYDDIGNLLTRTDKLPTTDIVETFTYDNLNRMLTSELTGQSQKTYAYDDLGNVTSKAGVGSYSYTGCGGRPHAVCSAGGNSYSYDANGNMTARGSRTVTYTGFNLPYEFKNGSTVLASFAYDANRNRVLKIAGSLHVRYVGMTGTGNPLFEQEYDGSTTRNIHYVYADGAQAVAQHITIGSSAETQYFHRDHLGSVEAISDDSGLFSAVDYVSYDAWGSRVLSPDAENVRLGFTGHETIAELTPDLVHMNGRVYDPLLGRFLSADPTVPDPYASQSYNRYTYVSNNPLSYPDPSGYDCCGWQGESDWSAQSQVYGYVDPSGMAYNMLGMSLCSFPPDCAPGNGFPSPVNDWIPESDFGVPMVYTFIFDLRNMGRNPLVSPGPVAMSYDNYMAGYSNVPGYGALSPETFGGARLSGGGGNQRQNNFNNMPTNWASPGLQEYFGNVAKNFNDTNSTIPGFLLPTGVGLATAGITAESIGGLTFLGTIQFVGTSHFGSSLLVAGFTSSVNVLAVGGAFQSGILAGSMINAIPTGNGQTVRDSVSNIFE